MYQVLIVITVDRFITSRSDDYGSFLVGIVGGFT